MSIDYNKLQSLSGPQLLAEFESIRGQGLNLDLTRGKPSSEQLDLSSGLINCLSPDDYLSEAGVDCRNYGGLDGLPELKRLFAEYLAVDAENVVIGGNSSLALMHDTMANAWLKGMPGGQAPWSQQPTKFLCPVPGYDRHFSLCEKFGISMIPVPFTDQGPDVDVVAEFVGNDDSIKGMWCVPKYSNPNGVCYSDAVVDALASMPAKAKDFRLFWDNAYQVHHLGDAPVQVKEIIGACAAAGNPNRPIVFASTSKISLPGAGVAVLASSPENLTHIKSLMAFQTIGPDKLNQLRHLRFFGDMNGIVAHMRKHAAILSPKFEAVKNILQQVFEGTQLCSWSNPTGGYFISLELHQASAREVVACAAQMGVKLTEAGATHPYKQDASDSVIRLAPSMPTLEDVVRATEVLAIAILLKSKKA
jgi:DNA-binding transcriptional MocR family regulator